MPEQTISVDQKQPFSITMILISIFYHLIITIKRKMLLKLARIDKNLDRACALSTLSSQALAAPS
jgi:hypothetical protein